MCLCMRMHVQVATYSYLCARALTVHSVAAICCTGFDTKSRVARQCSLHLGPSEHLVLQDLQQQQESSKKRRMPCRQTNRTRC